MHTPDYARDIDPSVYGEPIRPRRWSLARWNYRLWTAGTARVLRAMRSRRAA
jgi:hypothetical protein